MKERYKVPKPSKREKLDTWHETHKKPPAKSKPAAKSADTKVTVEDHPIQGKPVADKRGSGLIPVGIIPTRLDRLLSGRWPRRDGDKYDTSAEPPPKEVPNADPETRDL